MAGYDGNFGSFKYDLIANFVANLNKYITNGPTVILYSVYFAQTAPRGLLALRVLHFRTVREPRRDTSLIATRPLQPKPDLLSLGRYHLEVDGKPERNRPGFRTPGTG